MTKKILQQVLLVLVCGCLLLTSCTRKDIEAVPDMTTPSKNTVPANLTAVLRQVGRQLSVADLRIPRSLAITRPEEDITTTHAEYFITGTSDPKEPLSINGEAVDRQGDYGTFGALIPLEDGDNKITVTQGSFTKEVTITKEVPEDDPDPILISKIVQDSMYPLHHGGSRVGKTVPVSCTAPSGATVTASLGGETTQLEQVEAAEDGIPAVFTGSLLLAGDFVPDETINVGPVTYTLIQGKATEEFQSSGDIYVAGEDTNIVFEISNYIGFVYPSLDDLSVFTEIVKEGAADYLMWQSNKYFQLYSGGYIPTNMVRIVEGKDPVHNSISSIAAATKHKGERYEFSGTGKSFYDVRVTDEAVEFEVFNASLETATFPGLPGGSLFGEVEMTQQDRSVLFTFKRLPGQDFWGYNVTFEDFTTVLEFQHKPSLSKEPFSPLKGITIAIDPGHGGDDPGANGPAGSLGTQEADLNLAHAFALQNELNRLGADVQLTRDIDASYTLDERLEMHERFQADMFISLHQNSVEVNADANAITGMESYYYTTFSQPLARNCLDGLGETVQRKVRECQHSYYRVTLLPYSPSILIEMGFLSNPGEYEQSVTYETLQATAQGIAQGIIATLE